MGRILLAVDGANAMLQTKACQGRQGDLGGVIRMREHRFTKYCMPQGYKVKPACQLTIHPGLHAVGVAGFVQVRIGLHHVRNNPGAGLTVARGAGTRADDLRKCSVELDLN